MKLVKLFAAPLGLCLIVLGMATPVFAGVPDVPEIDPGAITGALAALSGGLLMLTDRLYRRK